MMFRRSFFISSLIALMLLRSSQAAGSPQLAQVELAGVLAFGGSVRVSLVDRIDGYLGWFEVGSTFNGLEIVEYFPDSYAVLVRLGGAERLVRLRTSEATSLRALRSRFTSRESEGEIVFDASQGIVFEAAQNRLSRRETRRRELDVLRQARSLSNR